MTGIPANLGLLLLTISVAKGAEAGWDGRMAEMFSGRWKEIQGELLSLEPQLPKLPGIPIDDQGGTGGYAASHPVATPAGNARFSVEIRWKESALVDLVALVPARRYDAQGLDAQYGLPEAFTVELTDAQGDVVGVVAREVNTVGNPVRKGHPFVYQVSPPLAAVGLRISADRLNADYANDGAYVHAWAEAMAFAGNRNLALDGQVRSIGGDALPVPWHWSPVFLVDGQTPLGLPEIPAGVHGDIGWISEGRATASDKTTLSVDLGEAMTIDTVRLLPSERPTADLPSGFGFPRKVVVSASEVTNPPQWAIVTERELGNPGHNPVVIAFESRSARHLKVEATELWKAFDDYPAFFALSELEVLSGDTNVALGKGMHSPDGMMNLIASGGKIWSATALGDGFGPKGRLVPAREWMIQLDQKLRLETSRHALRAEAGNLVDGWRRSAQLSLAALLLAGAFLIIALPIRFRVQANRELTRVRERIAGDLHDEVGSNLGSIQMFADLAEGRAGPSDELKRIQRIAAETVSAVRDIVWLLRPTGDHRIGTVEHLRETSSIMLETLSWKFTADEDAWQTELPEEANRDLFLFFREALHNVIRHAHAREVEIRAERTDGNFRLSISDDGAGIDPERLQRPATLRALRQRTEALGADLKIESRPGEGTCLILTVPLEQKRR